MKTDIDSLHNVIASGDAGTVGKNLVKCHELAGNVEVLEDTKICCFVDHYTDAGFILPMLKDVFAEHELKFDVTVERSLPTIRTSNNNIIVFTAGNTEGYTNVINFGEEK